MSGASGGWRSPSGGAQASGGLSSTAAPGASSGWIGAPAWSNSNAKWRDYYSGLEQPGLSSATVYDSVLPRRLSKDLNKALGKQVNRELKDLRRLVKHLY